MAEEKYDVIVVGAGMAGLFCANFLARFGKRTLLLEHNHQPGGLTGGFWRKGFYFDAGDQSFESGGIIFPYLKQLGFYRAEDWEPTDYTMAYEHGSVVMKDQEKALDKMADLFPNLRPEMYQLFAQMVHYSKVMGLLSSDQNSVIGKTGLDRVRSLANLGRAVYSHRNDLREMLLTPMPEFYQRFLPPSKERDQMSQLGYRNMPVLLGTGFWYTWFEDYWYYKRGQQGLMDDLVKKFQANGGKFLCNQSVDQILIEKQKVRGVSTRDGNKYFSNWVVFAGALKRLYTELIHPSYLDPEMIKEIEDAKVSEPLVALYLGVDMTHEELSRYLKTHHTLFFPEGPAPDYDASKNKLLHDSQFVEITWPSMRLPSLAPRNKNSLVLQTFSSCNWMDRWGTKNDDFARPRRYQELKQLVAEQMIASASRYIPGLKDRIVYQTLGSPLSTVRFTLNPDGASCGWSMELNKSYLKGKWFSMTTPIERLYSIGHYTFWPGGVPMAAMSGVLAAQMIKYNVGFEALRKVYRTVK